VIVFLVLLSSIGIPISFGVGFYIGRRSKYEDVNKLEPTPIITPMKMPDGAFEIETEHSRSEMVPLIQD